MSVFQRYTYRLRVLTGASLLSLFNLKNITKIWNRDVDVMQNKNKNIISLRVSRRQ